MITRAIPSLNPNRSTSTIRPTGVLVAARRELPDGLLLFARNPLPLLPRPTPNTVFATSRQAVTGIPNTFSWSE